MVMMLKAVESQRPLRSIRSRSLRQIALTPRLCAMEFMTQQLEMRRGRKSREMAQKKRIVERAFTSKDQILLQRLRRIRSQKRSKHEEKKS